MGILSLLLWTPALGTLLLALTSRHNLRIIRWIGYLTTSASLLIALYLASIFDTLNPAAQFSEQYILNAELGNTYALGVDGLSLPMVILASLLSFIALLTSSDIGQRLKTYHICILLVEMGLLGVFLTLDWALFYVFWEMTLIPLFFLIDRWGGNRRHTASLNFILYTFGGSIFILVSLFAMSAYVPPMGGSLMDTFEKVAQRIPHNKQIWILVGFLIGFGVKLPVFPLHGWLPLAHMEAPLPVNILLSGVILKMGTYGLLRVTSMLPLAIQTLQPVLLFLALFSMLYGGLLAWRQSDLKAMLAYSSISSMGIVLLGIATCNLTGTNGALLQMTAHGLIAGVLFLLMGLLVQRTGTSNIQHYSSVAHTMPRFAILTTLALLALMGMPGTLSFVSELYAIIGGFEHWGGWMVFFSISMLISAAYSIRTLGLLFTGPVKSDMQSIQDLTKTEFFAAGILISGILGLGFYPALLNDLSLATLIHFINTMHTRVM